ncbi:hypothetical protein OSB04_029144 [Centaurea solstitialis]|uniref:BZIP domain-containing protein n=1 Tax=Centaurea solstitialis TaxID=347529 RepID=A0AA38SHV1_9ASTR|nr:hypothetical protein OSB04_029144 [Centaurea solstitialis]
MDDIRASTTTPMAVDLVKIEMEAAEALAGLSHFPPNSSQPVSNNSSFPKCSSYQEYIFYVICQNLAGFEHLFCVNEQDAANLTLKKPEKSGILTSKQVKDEQGTDLRLNPPAYPTNCATTGRKSRQNLTEAEIEARKIRRVLANRESARQTIHRRQAIFEELTRKAVDLAWENEKLKREKEMASKKYDSLKTKNECLKAQMTKVMNIEAGEESNATNEPTVSASSTNSPFIVYNQPPFLPLVWPNPVQLQCGGIVFPSSSSCEEGSSIGSSPVYLLPYPWLVTTSLPQTQNGGSGSGNDHHNGRHHSFNLNDKPKESSSECQQFFPEKAVNEGSRSNDSHGREGFPPDGGGGGRTTTMADSKDSMAPVSCVNNSNLIKEDDDDDVKGSRVRVGDCEQIPVMWSAGNKRVGDSAAAEARKRRKELTRLKNNNFHCRQLRIMH